MLDSASPIRTPDGRFCGYLGSCTDISGSSTVSIKLDSGFVNSILPPVSKQTLDNAPIAIWKLDRELVVQKCNPAAGDQLAVDPSVVIGRKLPDFVRFLSKLELSAALEQNENLTFENQPVELLLNKQQRVWDISIWPLKDQDDHLIGMGMSTLEVSSRQMKEQQKADFVAKLVHDLKTPLIGAERTLEMMSRGAVGYVDPAQIEVLTIC